MLFPKVHLHKHLTSALALLASGFLFIGCAHNYTPLPHILDNAGVPHAFKRTERYPQRDYMHRFVRKAYQRPNKFNFQVPPGSDQANIVKEWGRPDWVRKRFRSLQDEMVQEWLYMDNVHMFQFIGSTLVFEGPLSHYEQVLLSKGYPDRAETSYPATATINVFVYTRMFWPFLEEYHFVNGEMNQYHGGN